MGRIIRKVSRDTILQRTDVKFLPVASGLGSHYVPASDYVNVQPPGIVRRIAEANRLMHNSIRKKIAERN